jgi:outer membrane protein assembly factor BamE (lipoprotein component of BamABCDE complex)
MVSTCNVKKQREGSMRFKKQMRFVFIMMILVITSIFLSSCFGRGNKRITNEKYTSQIKEGKSDKAKVKEILGEPESIQKAPGKGETWSYSYKPADSTCACGGISWTKRGEPQFLTIRFGEDGIVKNINKE